LACRPHGSCGRRRAARFPRAASRILREEDSFRRSLMPAIWTSLRSA
jgi:hypothetical protein